MGFFDVFFGTPQSLYASYAILAAIITICVTILLTGTDLTLGNRFLFVFLVILMLIPSIFLTLFQITCLVTGGNKNNRWWCWLYAWIVSVFVIIYCILVIVLCFVSLFTYTNAMDKVKTQENFNKMSMENSNDFAKSIMTEEGFANPTLKDKKDVFTDYTNPHADISQIPPLKVKETFQNKEQQTGQPASPKIEDDNTKLPEMGAKAEKKVVINEPEAKFTNFNDNSGLEAFTNMDDKYASF